MSDRQRERFRRFEAIFERAIDLTGDERRRYLDDACGADAAMRADVERALADEGTGGTAGDGRLTDVVGRAVADVSERTPESEDRVGRRIGPYRVLSTLGHGGMGVVFRAVRDDDQFRKEVAIKVVSPGRLGAEWIRRFRHERSLLARLDHPNIARVLDGGTTDDGLPYVAMEYVDGVPVDEWCEANGADLERRIELFREVCAAVHEAHRNLIVHRDLKPANVLVDADGRPRLLDFGIAKLLEPDDDATTAAPITATHGRLMTPDYASPEQVAGQTVSTASDVYSLGVLLYELLAGVRPYRLDSVRPAEMERLVCEVDPPPPSAAHLPEDSTTRTTTGAWRRRLRGDLDRIVGRAMHKDPNRRYASAEALAEDLRRHRDGLPVAARPDTWTYRTGKFVRRHRVGVVATTLLFALLAGFGATMARQSARIAAERDRVDIERDKAEAIRDYLVGLFRTPDESGVPGRDMTAAQLLAAGRERLDELEDQPLLRAELLETVGDVYLMLDMADDAEPLLRQSLALREEHGAGPLEVADSIHELGKLAYLRGDLREALAQYRLALDIRRAELGDDAIPVGYTWYAVATAHHYLHELEDAAAAYENALSILRGAGTDEQSGDIDALLGGQGMVFQALGRLEDAEARFRELLERARRIHGENHIATADAAASLATLLRRVGGRDEEADPLYRQAIDVRREALGRHSLTAQSINNYAVFLRGSGRPDEAGPLHYEALAMYREVLGDEHPDVGLALTNVSTYERLFGDPQRALATADDAVATFERTVGDGHWLYWTGRRGRALALAQLGRDDEAEAEWRAAVDGLLRALGPAHPRTVGAAEDLADWLRERDREADADEVLALLAPA